MSLGHSHSRQPLGFRLAPLLLALIAAGFMMLRGCQEGPFGRSQIVALSPDQEAALGAQAFQQILRESDVVRQGPIVDVVENIGRRIAQSAQSPRVLEAMRMKPQQFAWEFRVVRHPQANAFCLPGGKVVVYTGILPVCQNEAALACVMGHEIAHALAHHGAERMAHQQLTQLGQVALAQSFSNLEREQQWQLYAILGAGSRYGVLLPFSRKHESEADHMGMLLMADAGYDPRESIRFWQRMKQSSGSSVPAFASTHPSHETRANDLQGWLSEAMPLYQSSEQQPNRPFRFQ